MGPAELEAHAPTSAWRRWLLRAELVHASQDELDWLFQESGTSEGARRQSNATALFIMLPSIAFPLATMWRYDFSLLLIVVIDVAMIGFVLFVQTSIAARIEPATFQQRRRTMQRNPTPDDPTVPAGDRRSRRQVTMYRVAVGCFAVLLGGSLLIPLPDARTPNPISIGGVTCLPATGDELRVRGFIHNSSTDPYIVTIRASVATADDSFEDEQPLRVPARSSEFSIDFITGLTGTATRCEVTEVSRYQISD